MPRQLGRKAAAGEVAAGLLPLVDYFRLADTFERLDRFGVAVRGRAHSVLLFSRLPIRQLDGATILVTEETSTTAVLLRLLLEHKYHVAPKAYERVGPSSTGPRAGARPGTSQQEAGDALLLIGDEALQFKQTNTQYPFEIDLAFEWWLWQHTPFVFAVWAVRKDVPAPEKKHLELSLIKALAMNTQRLEEIAQRASASLGLPSAELQAYLANFIYRLSHPEEEGITRFKELVDEFHLLRID